MKNKKYAITGGIGSGKSTVSKIISELGYPVLSCDVITAQLYQKRKVKMMLKKIFPSAVKGVFNPTIDRTKIASLAFTDKILHSRLTNTITPLVLSEVLKQCKKYSGVVFVEVPLLFECNYQDYFDGVLVVLRDKTQRIESVKARSSLTEQQILERINNQVDYDKIDLSPYTVIKNDDMPSLKDKVIKAINNF